jgi:hypothetical protein
MNVDDLIKQLKAYRYAHGNVPVIVSSDSEGNAFNACETVEVVGYDSECRRVGLLPEQLTDEARSQGYEEEDVRGTPAICIWP